MISTHNIEQIQFKQKSLILKIDGKELSFPLSQISSKLLNADEVQRNIFKISPSGYGIHWPLIDEDLSVDSLLKSLEE